MSYSRNFKVKATPIPERMDDESPAKDNKPQRKLLNIFNNSGVPLDI